MERVVILWTCLLMLALGAFAPGCGGAPQSTDATTTAPDLYTCGMHPNVIQEGPGTCPICDMDLTPMRSASSGSNGVGPTADPVAATAGTLPPNGERKISHWAAPMDPAYTSDKPGLSPMGMQLVPVYVSETGDPPGVVRIDPVVIQNMGVRTSVVREQTIYKHLRTVGEVEVAEDTVSVVNLRFAGWVEKLYVDRTGDPVRRGQRLFDIYSPELVSAQEDYLLAVRTAGADSPLARSSRRKLELWDLDAADIDAVVQSGEASRTMPIRSPASGFVLHKNVLEGARVTAGADLYRVGNLARIWVNAEVYEFDAPWVAVGQPAQMELSYQQGTVLDGEVSYIHPTLNPRSRTLKVRLEFNNPGVALKPGMFATIHIQFRRKEAVLAVPTESVIHSGERELVFLSIGQGRFVAREVTTGLGADHHLTEILAGIEPGDVVVTSGQFLLDSESQLQEAIQKLLAIRAGGPIQGGEAVASTDIFSCEMHPDQVHADAGQCSECGMDLVRRPSTPDEWASLQAEVGGEEHTSHGHASAEAVMYTCPMHPEVNEDAPGRCPECGMFLEASGGQGYACPMHPSVTSESAGRCPVCGMFLESVVSPDVDGKH